MLRRLIAIGLLAVLAGAASLVACGTGGADADDGGADGGEFIAQESDFAGFCNWPTALAANDADASDGIHDAGGPLRVYWNHSPPHGSKTFPLGTIILKEPEGSGPKPQVFAMVKRGDVAPGMPFNAAGATGWEWWSLADNGDCTMTMLWRGEVAPAGETYTNTTAGDCNGCHGEASSNDYVWDTALQLSKF